MKYAPLVNSVNQIFFMLKLFLFLFHFKLFQFAQLQVKLCSPSPSTVPFDMEPEILPEGAPVPLNDLGEDFIKENSESFASISTVVPLNPKPWLRKWENLQTHLDGFRCSIF